MTQANYHVLEVSCDSQKQHPLGAKTLHKFKAESLEAAIGKAKRRGWQLAEELGEDDLCPHCVPDQ